MAMFVGDFLPSFISVHILLAKVLFIVVACLVVTNNSFMWEFFIFKDFFV